MSTHTITSSTTSSSSPPSARSTRPPAGPESRLQSMRAIKEISLHTTDDLNLLEMTWRDGARGLFHGAWLRDNCPIYFDKGTGQRMKNTLQFGPDAYALSKATISTNNASLSVTWHDGFSHEFSSSWLRQHCYETRNQYNRVQPRLWGQELISYFPGHVLPTLPYQEVVKIERGKPGSGWETSAHAFIQWITHLRDYGVALVEGVPTEPGTVMKMADLIAYHRKTHYGDSFQVISELKPQHLAYTPVELEPHTDLNYKESSPGIQLLHCLSSEAEGGESTFVDGFQVAETLRREKPQAFRTLCEVPIPFVVKVGEVGYQYHKIPTICVDDAGQLVEVHFNERTRAPLELPATALGPVYEALAEFQAIVHRPELGVEVKMKAGDMVAFNNRRILHGRKAFDPRTGMRHLEGCYCDMDEFSTCLRKHGITPLGGVSVRVGGAVEGEVGKERGSKKRFGPGVRWSVPLTQERQQQQQQQRLPRASL